MYRRVSCLAWSTFKGINCERKQDYCVDEKIINVKFCLDTSLFFSFFNEVFECQLGKFSMDTYKRLFV